MVASTKQVAPAEAIDLAVAAVLVLVAGLASYLPARTDPQLALRGET